MPSGDLVSRFSMLATVTCTLLITGIFIRREFFLSERPAVDMTPVRVTDWEQVTDGGNLLGPPVAPVSIVEFGDFECAFCARFATVTLPEVRKAYPTEVSFRYRHWPLEFHKMAYPAARASECAAQQGRFEPFYELLYIAASRDSLGVKSFTKIAQEARIPDMAAFETCNSRSGKVDTIERDIAEAKRIGARGTPTILVNGWRFRGTPDFARMDSIIRAELAKAETAGR